MILPLFLPRKISESILEILIFSCFKKKLKAYLHGSGVLSKDDAETTFSHCVIAEIFVEYHAFVATVIVWNHPVVLASSDNGNDVLEPASGIVIQD